MTQFQKELHEYPNAPRDHVPAIQHRTGGPTAEELNVCGICGCYIAFRNETWTEIGEEEADRLRHQSSGPRATVVPDSDED